MRMKLIVPLLIASALTAQTVVAQRPREQRSHPDKPPEHSREPKAKVVPPPAAPVRRPRPDARPDVERRREGGDDDRPHVNRGRWYGHAPPNDRRFYVERPFEHGRFVRIGPAHRYRVVRFDRELHRVWLPGGFFEIAPWDWP